MSEAAAAAAADDDTTKVNLVSASIAAYVFWYGRAAPRPLAAAPPPRPADYAREQKLGAVGWDGTGDIDTVMHICMYIYPSDPSLLSDRRRSSRGVGHGVPSGRGRAGVPCPPPRPNDLCASVLDTWRIAPRWPRLTVGSTHAVEPTPPPPRAPLSCLSSRANQHYDLPRLDSN